MTKQEVIREDILKYGKGIYKVSNTNKPSR
jgi:hypothetical protein